jgi:glycosyltransferase involved in cell wall biosynthesis
MSVCNTSSLPLSVVIIAKNEARRIGDCIDSVRKLTNDIVVVDSGSTDRTREICLARGARVIEHTWEGFSRQKNFGNNLARYDWILSLDADERVSKKLASSIRHEFTGDPTCDAYTFRFRNFFEGKPVCFGAWNPDSHTRLFDRRKFSWNDADVHEGLIGTGEVQVGELSGNILHFTVESRAQLAAKTEFYTSLFADNARRNPQRISWRKVWLNPSWRFFRDYIFRLGILDGFAGWNIACEGMRYTYLKYSKIAAVTGGYRQPNWIGLGAATAALALTGLVFTPNRKPEVASNHVQQPQVEKLGASNLEADSTQLASYDDNYEDAGVVLPVDDEGVV